MSYDILKFEVKSKLAKLLAAENIHFEHDPSAKSAYFDIKSRRLVLPVWKNISERLYDMLIVHEVGHALDTPFDAWMEAIENIAQQNHGDSASSDAQARIKDFINVIEDARIDKRQKRRYPGSKADYAAGYKELHEKDFFGLSKIDHNKLPLIDRINLLFKNGAYLDIQFSDDELAFVKQIEDAETFADVVRISGDLYARAVAECNENNQCSSVSSGTKNLKVGILTDDADESAGDGDEKFDVLIDARENDEQDAGDDDSGESTARADASDDSGEAGEASDEKDSSEADGETESASPTIVIPASFTADAMKRSMDTITQVTNEQYVYVDIPSIDPYPYTDDWSVVIPQMTKAIDPSVSKDFLAWKARESDTVAYMVKEFELLKAADAFARQRVSKSGSLDMNKLHQYKMSDDIFLRNINVAKGKNHGFFIVLDWSGSMSADIRATMKRLLSLTMFCRKIGVPFEVYLFRSYDPVSDGKWTPVPIANPEAPYVQLDPFRLRNILSSRMNSQQFTNAMNVLYKFTHIRNRHSGAITVHDHMNGTPLDQTILACERLINDFRATNRVQIVNAVFLTDGASDGLPIREQKEGKVYSAYNGTGQRTYIFRDPITKKVYYPGRQRYFSGQKTTSMLLDSLKHRVHCNLVGFFLFRGKYGSDQFVWGMDRDPKQEKMYNDEGFACLDNRGYDEFYVMNIKKITDETDQSYMLPTGATTHAAAKTYIKSLGARQVSRVMIKRFIKRIASEFH